MTFVIDLINLLGVVFLVSGGLAVLFSLGTGKKDVSHLLLPDEIQHHPREWGAFTIESAQLTSSGQFQLALRSGSGEVVEMLIKRLSDVLASCLYDPGWYLPVSGTFTLDVEEEMTSSGNRLVNLVREHMTGLGMEETQATAKGVCLGITRDDAQGGSVLMMTLNDTETSRVLWQGRTFVNTAESDPGGELANETQTRSLPVLCDMLATRRFPPETLDARS